MFSVHTGINIIIPLAGLGMRFKEDGYTMPKPLVKVLGEPIIFHVLKSLKTRANDKIYIVYTPCLEVYGFSGIISKYFPNVNLIKISYPTRGAVETVLCGLQQIPELNNPVLICDGDTFYKYDIIQDCYDIPGNSIFYFEDKTKVPIFSYIKITFDCKVTAIKEKEKISDMACSGAYLFKSGKLLKLYCEQLLQTEQTSKGEYYISGIYNQMIETGERVNALLIENFTCLGTPNQVKTYCMVNNDVKTNNHKRICFDLDGTLCTFPPKNEYFWVKPIEKNIKKLKHLHSLGHTIIIHTARGMGSTGQNTGAALSKAHESVFWFLKEYEVPYDEIYFGKPQADFYVDDLAIPAHTDLDKELGFYDGKIEPRYFNKVRMNDTWTFKETNNPGEVYWYQNIPEAVKMHFPVVNQAMFINGFGSIMIETIKGVPLSYLLVNGSLTTADIDLLFETLDKIHNSEYALGNIDIYGNYAKKVSDRIEQINNFNFPNWGTEAYHIIQKLKEYENNDLGIKGVLHGDTVFTNIFLCNGRLLKFIDMRGMVGPERTIFGDIIYDFAKVYQSICGYDFILTGTEINEPYQNELKDYFEKQFIKRFPKHFDWLKLITASHFLSLIPLHTDYDKQIKYLSLMKKLIE